MRTQLKASFSLPSGTLSVIAEIMTKRIREPHRLEIIHGNEHTSHVRGDAQDVMFFIGEVASHGYDDLFMVQRIAG